MTNKLIAIVEDEPDIRELISIHLKKSGFTTAEFDNPADFFKFISGTAPELIILDLMLPDTDGLEICKRLKKEDAFLHIPIIIVTAKAEESDKILGLELGADDYIVKPFSVKELIARVKAVLRRPSVPSPFEIITIGGILHINLQKHEAMMDGLKLELTVTEFNILRLLASRKGWVFKRDDILNHLWGQEKDISDRTVDVHIKNLRDKLGRMAKFIKNIRGVGYKLEE